MTSHEQPPTGRPVGYKGEPLDAERGPGLGCFRFQVGLLVALLVLTPLSVAWNWPPAASALLLFLTLIILLFAGQTVIFLLRLVAADRRDGGRRRPLASPTRTVGELEDADSHADATSDASEAAQADPFEVALADPGTTDPGVRE
jgi:hypothetical protein